MEQSKAYKNLKQASSKDIAALGVKALFKGKRTVIYEASNNLLVCFERFIFRGMVLKTSKFISGK